MAAPLSIQTASLYASGFFSQFSGTGGPWGYDIFTSQFGGVVSSAGLATEPFNDTLWDVDGGDEVTFVVAVQNLSAAAIYNLKLKDVIPAGFATPSEGVDLSVTDGAGNVLATSGDLFGAGLQLTAPVPAYDANSGANVVLLTFTVQASSTVQVPKAVLSNTATIVSYANSAGGANAAGSVPAASLTATTPVTTSAPTLESTPDQDLITLATGQTAAFDVALTLPEGQTKNLTIAQLLPHSGSAWMTLVSAEVIHVGINLTATNPVKIQADGSLSLGTVTNTPDDMTDYDDEIVLRLTVKPGGTSSGVGTITTQVSSTDPNGSGQPYTASVTNTMLVAAGDVAPTIAGTAAGQAATTSMVVHPFAQLSLADPDAGQTETLTIRISDTTLGSLGNAPAGTYDSASGTFSMQGSIAAVQSAARALTFVGAAGHTGTESFVTTLNDGAGGVASDSTATLVLSAPIAGADSVPHFALSPTATATVVAAGTTTTAQLETYGGGVSYLQAQLILDGTATGASVVPQTPNVFVKNMAGSDTVTLSSGQNVVDAGPGTNYLTSGSGNDTFFVDGRQGVTTWDSIANFHKGDMVTVWGFTPGTSSYSWADGLGSGNWAGRTLQLDVTGSGHVQESVTFAGATSSTTSHFALTTGTVGGINYLQVTSL